MISHVLLVTGVASSFLNKRGSQRRDTSEGKAGESFVIALGEENAKARVPAVDSKTPPDSDDVERGQADPRLSLSQPQTLKSLSQLFDLRGMAAKEHPCRQGGPLGLSRERAAQPDLAWEATPERRINSAGKFLALSASSASLQLAAARITQSSATLVPALGYITPPDHCRQSRLCRQPKSPKLPSSVHSAKASSATQKSCMISAADHRDPLSSTISTTDGAILLRAAFSCQCTN